MRQPDQGPLPGFETFDEAGTYVVEYRPSSFRLILWTDAAGNPTGYSYEYYERAQRITAITGDSAPFDQVDDVLRGFETFRDTFPEVPGGRDA